MASDEPIDGRCSVSVRNGDGYCENYPVDGASTCRVHGGTGGAPEGNQNAEGNSGGSAPEDNQNAVTHSIHADTNAVYQKVFSDKIRRVVDDIYQDYIDKYTELHGEPPYGHTAELFRIAVSYGKHLHSEEWAVNKPAELKSGNAMVDKETSLKTTVDRVAKEETYKQTVVQKGQKQLSQDRRMWLKDLGLLDTSPEDREADAQEDMADAWREALTEG